MRKLLCLLAVCFLVINTGFAQGDSSSAKVTSFQSRFLTKFNAKAHSLDQQLDRQSAKYLAKMAKTEARLKAQLAKQNPGAAQQIFSGSDQTYKNLSDSIRHSKPDSTFRLSGEYNPYTDSLKSSLAFLSVAGSGSGVSPKLTTNACSSLKELNQYQSRLNAASDIQSYIRRRKQQLKDQLQAYVQNSNVQKYLNQYNQQVYYYSTQVKDAKNALNDPDKLLQKALIMLNKLPAFHNFIATHGQLAGLFGIPADYGSAQSLDGLQTRSQVQNLLQGQIGAGGGIGASAFESSLSSAHQQLDQFKDKLTTLGAGSADIDMPTFKPNSQKTRPFLKRLELGTNLQTARANWYFPSTTDIGLSLGYKITGKTTIGVGISYKIGWGSNINHINITNQGIGFRSFIDMPIKKSFYLTGGYEENYVTPFTSVQQLKKSSLWQQSGLIGITKMIALPGKIIKKTKVSLLWDFLSYTQIPRQSALKFRIGYNF